MNLKLLRDLLDHLVLTEWVHPESCRGQRCCHCHGWTDHGIDCEWVKMKAELEKEIEFWERTQKYVTETYTSRR